MSDESTAGRQWMEGRNGWWTASIAVIILVLAGLVAVLVLGGGDDTPTAAPAPTATTTPPTTTATQDPTAPPTAGACDLDATDQTVPETAPDAQWQVYNTVALPWSPTAGPTQRDGGVWTCFARTPAGALNAATILSTTPYGLDAQQVLERQVITGPERDAQLESVQREPPAPAQPGSTGVVAGYRFIDYTQDRATIQIAFAYGGELFVWTTALEWVGGDWKLNLDPAGGAVPGQPLASLEGYTEWGAS